MRASVREHQQQKKAVQDAILEQGDLVVELVRFEMRAGGRSWRAATYKWPQLALTPLMASKGLPAPQTAHLRFAVSDAKRPNTLRLQVEQRDHDAKRNKKKAS